MPPALAYEGVQRALLRLGIASAIVIGPADVKDALRVADLTDAEAMALAAEVDALAVLIGTR